MGSNLVAVLLGLMAVLVGAGTIFMALVIGALNPSPPPPGWGIDTVVDPSGAVELDARSYLVGVLMDVDHPDYVEGTRLARPECRVTDRHGVSLPFDATVRRPEAAEFVEFARFRVPTAGTHTVTCTEVAPSHTTLVARTDAWEEHRRLKDEQRTSLVVVGVVGGAITAVCGLAARAVFIRPSN